MSSTVTLDLSRSDKSMSIQVSLTGDSMLDIAKAVYAFEKQQEKIGFALSLVELIVGAEKLEAMSEDEAVEALTSAYPGEVSLALELEDGSSIKIDAAVTGEIPTPIAFTEMIFAVLTKKNAETIGRAALQGYDSDDYDDYEDVDLS